MDPALPWPLLDGLSPQAFMRRHWQRRPLLVRQAWPGVVPPLARPALFALAASDAVESRLVQRVGPPGAADGWRLRHGPLPRRALPPLARPGWTLLVQGLDLHVPAAHAMLARFAFLPYARLDDLMVSWASEGGGVGPHVDSYDVFLIQLEGRRRWRVAPPAAQGEDGFVPGLPLKILRRFEPTSDWVLEPGDMLYLPPRWGHDGVADGGPCMTASVGLRAPARGELARALLPRLVDELPDDTRRYADPGLRPTTHPAALPPAMAAFAAEALARAAARLKASPARVAAALGEWLTEPKPGVWFERAAPVPADAALRLDARSRMLYDEHHLYLNGEAFRAGGRDARLLRALADSRCLTSTARAWLSPEAAAAVDGWCAAGWLRAAPEGAEEG